jgi:hypothetical protein
MGFFERFAINAHISNAMLITDSAITIAVLMAVPFPLATGSISQSVIITSRENGALLKAG